LPGRPNGKIRIALAPALAQYQQMLARVLSAAMSALRPVRHSLDDGGILPSSKVRATEDGEGGSAMAPRSATEDVNGIEAFAVDLEVNAGWGDTLVVLIMSISPIQNSVYDWRMKRQDHPVSKVRVTPASRSALARRLIHQIYGTFTRTSTKETPLPFYGGEVGFKKHRDARTASWALG
jgi:hypothetical protein